MTQPAPAPAVAYPSFRRVLLFLSFILFAVAALCAGGVVSAPEWAFGFGGFACWALSWTVP
jgi:hypothetical protein